MIKKVLIIGVTGQDGSSVIKYLLENTDCVIYGTVRKLSNKNHVNIENFKDERLTLVEMDLSDYTNIKNIIIKINPHYIINFASQSLTENSWDTPFYTLNINSIGVLNLLECIKDHVPTARFYSSGSSEEFGDVEYSPQDLNHPMRPRNMYGLSKCTARNLVKLYREKYNLYVVHCIMYNHEGIRRGEEFITRKITKNLSKIKYQIEKNLPIEPLELGNILSVRDWSACDDFMVAIWLMLNQTYSRDYLLSSNNTHSVKEFIDISCKYLDLNVKWIINNSKDYKLLFDDKIIVKINEKFYRDAEKLPLCGNCSETMKTLNWKPKITFEELIRDMINYDYGILQKTMNNN